MDGTMDVEAQIRLMRSVIGRKYMEMDEFIEKSISSVDGDKYEAMIEFLKNDIKGYKAIIDDLKDGSRDLTGDYFDIASLPEKLIGLYNDFYLPQLKEQDLADEEMAMGIKSKYATDLVLGNYIKIGRAALESPLLISLMSRNNDIAAVIGKLVLAEPELVNALNEESL